MIKRNVKSNTTDAYVRSLERFFVDYGKRYNIGKKGAALRNMNLFKLVLKNIDLVSMLQELYLEE